jgi:hypothetical protein
MVKILPNQVYAGLHEILKNKNLFYHSSVGGHYCHLTEAGKEEVIKWVELMAPGMYKLEQDELDARAKKLVWAELKK